MVRKLLCTLSFVFLRDTCPGCDPILRRIEIGVFSKGVEGLG